MNFLQPLQHVRTLRTAARRRNVAPGRRPHPLLRRHETEARLRAIEQTLEQVHAGIERNANLARGLETVIQRVWSAEATQALQRGINVVLPYLQALASAPRYAFATVCGVLGLGYVARSQIYEKVSEESAELGRQVLDRNVANLTHTLKAVAVNEETLSALVELLGRLLDAQATRTALIELLVTIFQDEALVHKTGVFALEALDTLEARQMLDTQLARLASATLRDAQVQRDAGFGARAALKTAAWGRRRGSDNDGRDAAEQ